MTVKEAADKAIEIAYQYSKRDPRLAAEHGLAYACKAQGMVFKNKVRAELNKRGFRI